MCCFLPPLPSEKSKNRLRKNSNSLQCFITQKPNKHTPLLCFPWVLSMFPLPRHSNIFWIPVQRSSVRWDWAWNASLHNKTKCVCKFHFYPIKDNRNAQDSYSPSALCWKEGRTKPLRNWKGQYRREKEDSGYSWMVTPCNDTAQELYKHKSPQVQCFLTSVFEEQQHTILKEF